MCVTRVGATTDGLLGQNPVHCLGHAGDAFLANYMTAHFVAPNTSPAIRYAVYFRVKGPGFPRGVHHNPVPMLLPLEHWRLGAREVSFHAGPGGARAGAGPRRSGKHLSPKVVWVRSGSRWDGMGVGLWGVRVCGSCTTSPLWPTVAPPFPLV